MEEKKKSPVGTILLVIIIILLMVTCLIGGYLINEMNNKKDKDGESVIELDEEEPEESEIVYEVTDEKIKKLIENIQHGYRDFGCNSIENLINDKKVTTKDITNLNAYLIGEYDYIGENKQRDSVSLEEFNNSVKKYLGKDYKFNPEDVDYKGQGCPQYNYDKNTKTFNHQTTQCGWTCGPHSDYKIVKAVEKNGVLKMTVKAIFYTYEKNDSYYSDYARTNALGTQNEYFNTERLETLYDKGSDYLFTFKNEDGNYVYVSSEPV